MLPVILVNSTWMARVTHPQSCSITNTARLTLRAMSTSKSWTVTRHTMQCTSPVSAVLQFKLVYGWGLRKWRRAPRYGICGLGNASVKATLTSSFQCTQPNSFSLHRHDWSRASILCTSLLVTAQHSEPYRKMNRMQVLYSLNLVDMEIRDFHIRLSRFLHSCMSDGITMWDIRRALSCWMDERVKTHPSIHPFICRVKNTYKHDWNNVVNWSTRHTRLTRSTYSSLNKKKLKHYTHKWDLKTVCKTRKINTLNTALNRQIFHYCHPT